MAESTGFNGDAVLSYELKDKSGNVVSASDSSTPVSGEFFAGLNVFEANPKVIEKLTEVGALLKTAKISR